MRVKRTIAVEGRVQCMLFLRREFGKEIARTRAINKGPCVPGGKFLRVSSLKREVGVMCSRFGVLETAPVSELPTRLSLAGWNCMCQTEASCNN